MSWKFSRSHQISLHQCPRLAFLRYYDGGKGWESRRIDVAQSTGSLLHSIIGELLKWVKELDMIPGDLLIDSAVKGAVDTYRTECAARGLDIEQIGGAEFELNRQAALAEGMARAWVKVRLPGIHEKYRVVSVEEEWEIALDAAGQIVCMIRIDATFEARDSGDLWAFEMKTTGWMDDSWLEKWRYDSQTLMHVWATEKHFGKPCAGVIIEAFYKGVKRKDPAGHDVYYSPLIHGYLKRGVPPFDSDELSWDSSNSRRKGWESVDVWQWGKVKDWVAALPDEVLAAQLFSTEVFRSDREQEVWLRQTLREQTMLSDSLVWAAEPGSEEQERAMDVTWPARLNADCYSNKFRKRCPFLDVCYKGIEPSESELYVVRTPHHAGEHEE